MKASELIIELQNQIKAHHDREVYFEQDEGVRVVCGNVGYSKQTYIDKYSAYHGWLKDAIIINFSI